MQQQVKVHSINIRQNFRSYFDTISCYDLLRLALKSFNISLQETVYNQIQLSHKELLFLNDLSNQNLITTSFLQTFYRKLLNILYPNDIELYPIIEFLDYKDNEITIYNYVFSEDQIRNIYDPNCFNLSLSKVNPIIKKLYNGMDSSDILKKFIPFYFGNNSRYYSKSLIDRLYLIDINNIKYKTRNIIYNTNGNFKLLEFVDHIKYESDILDLFLELRFYLDSYKIDMKDIFEIEKISTIYHNKLIKFEVPELYKVCTIKKGEYIFD